MEAELEQSENFMVPTVAFSSVIGPDGLPSCLASRLLTATASVGTYPLNFASQLCVD